MPAIPPRRLWLLIGAVAASLSLGACSGFTDRTRSALVAITPYKVDVVQGNFVAKEQVEALKPGMPRQQVREILGTPLLNDIFHADRWDYVFTIRRQGVEPQERRLTVFFKDDVLDHFTGDPMPSETEFVATLDARKHSGKVPNLEATPDELKKYEPSKDKQAAEASPAPLPPLPASYPPLETAR